MKLTIAPMRYRLTEYSSDQIVTFQIESIAGQPNALKASWDVSSLKSVLWPQFTQQRREDELWRTTCLELFIGKMGEASYVELNVSPTGGWNAYQFNTYREGMKQSEVIEIINFHVSDFFLEATFQGIDMAFPITLGPAVIIEKEGGELDYFAIKHGDNPDFHDAALHTKIDHL